MYFGLIFLQNFPAFRVHPFNMYYIRRIIEMNYTFVHDVGIVRKKPNNKNCSSLQKRSLPVAIVFKVNDRNYRSESQNYRVFIGVK
jgi:hypothetical protein